MLQAGSILLLLVFGLQRPSDPTIDITKSTIWRTPQDITFADEAVRFRPDVVRDQSTACARILADMTFRNNSERTIREIDFEIVLFEEVAAGDAPRFEEFYRKEQQAKYNILPGGKDGYLFQDSVCGLKMPTRQEVRVVKIEYTEGPPSLLTGN